MTTTTTTTKLIGISGCTSSGKTTLANLLVLSLLNSAKLTQDDYYYKPERIEYISELHAFNFDSPRAINFDRLLDDLNQLLSLSRYEYVIVEGSMIYACAKLCSLLDKKYFLTLSRETCKERRLGRRYAIQDPAGYFESVLWPEYLRYESMCVRQYDDIVYLDGAVSKNELLEYCINEINTSVI